MIKIAHVVGTRPNFIKIAPIISAFSSSKGIRQILIHTGQHFDANMSKLFFTDLEMPRPDYVLNVEHGSTVKQLSEMMTALESIFLKEQPNLVVVVGDVNSTLAGALTAKKMNIPLCHVEAGLRSFDRSMPEEINRIIIDHISDYLFTTEQSAITNLENERIPKEKSFFVGNVMIDSLLAHRKKAASSDVLERMHLTKKKYVVLTLHRPGNVDYAKSLIHLTSLLEDLGKRMPIVFPVHPRTRKNIGKFGLEKKILNYNVILCEPLGYLDFLSLMDNCALVLTDSGGIQEETTALGIPCITLRENTERPATVECGTNVLVSTDKTKILAAANSILDGKTIRKASMPPLWDGNAAERIAKVLRHALK